METNKAVPRFIYECVYFFRTGAHYFYSRYTYGYGSVGMFRYYRINCEGYETSLSQCSLQQGSSTNNHYYDVGVSCDAGQFQQKEGHKNLTSTTCV